MNNAAIGWGVAIGTWAMLIVIFIILWVNQ